GPPRRGALRPAGVALGASPGRRAGTGTDVRGKIMAKAGRAGLGLWDRVVLLLAWGVTCGLVYLLGFYVGKGMHERPLGREDRLVRLPVISTPPPAGQRPKAESDLTFYDTLAGSERAVPHPPHEAAAPTPTPAPAAQTPAPAAPATPPAAAAAPPAHPTHPKE